MNDEALALIEASSARTPPQVRLSDGRRLFVKRRSSAPADFFMAEARGLAALAQTATLRVPQVFAVSAHGIVVEDLGSGRPAAADWEAAGRALADLHRHGADEFGFDREGYCGDTPQDHTRDHDGFRFFAERRLLPQARQARERGLLDARDVQRVEALCARLRDLLPEAPPVLVHGDLWTGNLHACDNGELALIDGAAVHYGWRECDLAMLILFGEHPRAFFAAYESVADITGGWRRRAPLLNLYHLLNHLNLFGTGYLAGVRSVLARHS
jgi:fructosamine-3-kinase